ncbi:hypothetical protein HPB47_011708 [Ixodes persulcatus]|uniref:Uncharacterized protein n=1 Tax=Ixodes persulcatus TaxID=34615 RepID=A0AC60NVL1_IXOPE|nr:hypothetical protein HPB47_011708 [Ixodes persulcatus]
MLYWLGHLRRTLVPRGLENLTPAAETPLPHYVAVVATQRRVTQELPGVHSQQLPASRTCESLCSAAVSPAHQSRSSQPILAGGSGAGYNRRETDEHWGVATTDSCPNCPFIESNGHALVGCVVARTFWTLVARAFGVRLLAQRRPNPLSSVAPSKAQCFVLNVPAETPIDAIIDAFQHVVGQAGLRYLQHHGGARFIAAVSFMAAAQRLVAQGSQTVRQDKGKMSKPTPRLIHVQVHRVMPVWPRGPFRLFVQDPTVRPMRSIGPRDSRLHGALPLVWPWPCDNRLHQRKSYADVAVRPTIHASLKPARPPRASSPTPTLLFFLGFNYSLVPTQTHLRPQAPRPPRRSLAPPSARKTQPPLSALKTLTSRLRLGTPCDPPAAPALLTSATSGESFTDSASAEDTDMPYDRSDAKRGISTASSGSDAPPTSRVKKNRLG